MRSNFNHINIFLSIILFNEILSVDFTYPSSISLLNGNIFVIEKNGIFVYDEQLKNTIYSYTFEENDKINNLTSLSNVIIKYKRNYILCLINSKIYFFNDQGENILITDELITDENISHITITLIGIIGNFYYYAIGYLLYESSIYYIKLISYKIDLIEKTNNYIDAILMYKFTSSFWGNEHYFANNGLGCEYMEPEDNDEKLHLTCFFMIKKGDSLTLTHYFFDIYSNSINKNEDYYYTYVENLYNIKQIQAMTNSQRKYTLVCLLFTDHNLECYKFKFSSGILGNFYSNIVTNFNCRNELYSMKLNYLADVGYIALSCINSIATVQAVFFDDDLESVNSYQQFTECETIYGHSVISSKNNSAFYVISNAICNNHKRCFEPLEGTLSPIEEIDVITPTQKESYLSEYVENKTEIKTEIEKNIETEKIEEEKTVEIIKEETTQLIEQEFDCSSLEKCGECDLESFNQNLCINCNNSKKYFYLYYFPSKPLKYINCIYET